MSFWMLPCHKRTDKPVGEIYTLVSNSVPTLTEENTAVVSKGGQTNRFHLDFGIRGSPI